MNNLSAFLSQNVKKIESIKYIVSDRFVIDNKPVEWEVKPITSIEDENLRKISTKRIKVSGKSNQYTQEIDYNMYLGKLATACTVYPDLNDVELQNSYNVMGSDNLLKVMLSPGEYSNYLLKIQEINGFNTTMEELVEDAKN